MIRLLSTKLRDLAHYVNRERSTNQHTLKASKASVLTLVLVLMAMMVVACNSAPDVHLARGRSIEIQVSRPVVKTKMSFLDDEGKHRVVRPRASNRQLAMVEIAVVNRTSTVMPLLIDEEAAELGDRRGERIEALDPFVNSRVVEAAGPKEDEFAPLLWGEVQLDRDFQVKGWMIFDVPKGLTL
ncbi:MAG TPA: hypothetical protein DDY93_02510, partial [Dehalococcoidia bacterium]|nr:hypothetical protein [Dehalococcoidia bacterium]